MDVCLRFGIVPCEDESRPAWPGGLPLAPGTITLITGPSGSGKTRLLDALACTNCAARFVGRLAFPTDVAVIDAVAPTEPLRDALELLGACALGEPQLWLRRFDRLSEGEQFRARLARAISLHRRSAGGPLLCDEFCTPLHRRAAKAIAFNLRKLVGRLGIAVVVATAHDDLEADLAPDVIVRVARRGVATIERPKQTAGARRLSFARRLRIERGALRDYEAMADLHYRKREQVAYVDKVFALRDGVGGELLGVVVYGHPPLELALRNQATRGRFVKNASRLNRELRILRRLVIHPDVRGCGLGHWLVRETLPMAGTRYVECMAAMGLVNPVFEKAGMRRIGLCAAPASRERIVRELRALGVDPLSAGFPTEACRRPRVRRLVAQGVAEWYRASTGGGERRVERQQAAALARTFRQLIGSRPVYYLWSRDDEVEA